MDLFFETFSALGTVGLSTGATGLLDTVGKIIVMVTMFLGRVGPLSLFVLLAGGGGQGDRWRLPVESVQVG